jgi:hypothetical protein
MRCRELFRHPNSTMQRFSRLVFALVAALLFVMGGTAWAGEPSIGEMPPQATATTPPLVVPRDVPIVLPTAAQALPPLPPSYVTKELGWLELSYPPAAEERVASLVRDADAIKVDLESTLGQPVLAHVVVRVAPTVADMARLAPADAPPPEYASGVAYNGMHFVLLSMLAPRGAEAVDLDEVFRHELAHVALEDAVLGKHVPVWFNEGLAIGLSGEDTYARTKTLWSATLSGTLLPLAELDRRFPHDDFKVGIAYAESADFMRFLTRKSDRLRFAALIERVREGQAFERAIAEAYGGDLRRLEFEWRGSLEQRFSVIPVLTGGGLIWILVIGGLGLAYVRRRRRAKAILARWEREEAIEDAILARARARAGIDDPARPSASPAALSGGAQGAASASAIKIADDGRWHTLH